MKNEVREVVLSDGFEYFVIFWTGIVFFVIFTPLIYRGKEIIFSFECKKVREF